MNLKVKNTIIPHGQPGILIPLDKARPIFQEVVGVNSIVGELDVDDPAFPDWLRQEGFPCKRIEEHKQESVNTQSEIVDVNEARMNMVFKIWSQKY